MCELALSYINILLQRKPLQGYYQQHAISTQSHVLPMVAMYALHQVTHELRKSNHDYYTLHYIICINMKNISSCVFFQLHFSLPWALSSDLWYYIIRL